MAAANATTVLHEVVMLRTTAAVCADLPRVPGVMDEFTKLHVLIAVPAPLSVMASADGRQLARSL